ncbi:Hypothetical protein NTJ_09062 [Nesidiocoris tenuis]|uniref:Uncharacterized protein n=1 Tax=Nesidiocoris tenuis TaxID=355587 RepID=A0ABN7AVQ0_9HEMI|nr:Hypothetical protein NTJ_09062 [Nesidiocoris tenuis]
MGRTRRAVAAERRRVHRPGTVWYRDLPQGQPKIPPHSSRHRRGSNLPQSFPFASFGSHVGPRLTAGRLCECPIEDW